MKKEWIICIAIVSTLIFVSFLSSTHTVPYLPNRRFQSQPALYEGLTTQTKDSNDAMDEDVPAAKTKSIKPLTIAHDKLKNKKPKTKAKAKPDETEFEDTETFQNRLEGQSYGGSSEPRNMWYMSDVKSSLECGTKSAALSNSRGYLCLSQDQIRYLQTRGGNATTRSDF